MWYLPSSHCIDLVVRGGGGRLTEYGAGHIDPTATSKGMPNENMQRSTRVGQSPIMLPFPLDISRTFCAWGKIGEKKLNIFTLRISNTLTLLPRSTASSARCRLPSFPGGRRAEFK